MKKVEAVVLVLVAVLCAGPALAGEAGWQQVATTHTGSATIEWQPQADAAGYVLTVSGPDGTVVRREFKARETPSFSLFDERGQSRADGIYTYELRAVPRIDKATRDQLRAARQAGDEAAVVADLQKAGRIPAESLIQSGSFTIAGGAIVTGEATEAGAGGQAAKAVRDPNQMSFKDQVIPDDLIVQGSICAGFDCVNNESFGFDTIRLKENNLRIKFEDTSVGTFPTNDWQLTANDSASGASSKFSIEDITGAKVPFTITAGASTNSIFVDSTGRVGLRTSTPVLDLHINTSNTPSIRLEQNNSGGFTAQTWDIAGNEANFFVRDVTSGSRLPFRIRPGAPTSSVDISADGDVGIGTGSPDVKLHVEGSNGATKLTVEETSGTNAAREIIEMRNNGSPLIIFTNTSGAVTRYSNGLNGTSFVIDNQGNAGVELTLASNGNMTILGTLTENSSREVKENFEALDPKLVLARLNDLPMSIWSYKSDTARHMGPVAEDFYQAFGLGANDKGIAPGDKAGVALVALKGLQQVVAEKDAAISQLQQQNSELAARLAAIEEMLKGQAE